MDHRKDGRLLRMGENMVRTWNKNHFSYSDWAWTGNESEVPVKQPAAGMDPEWLFLRIALDWTTLFVISMLLVLNYLQQEIKFIDWKKDKWLHIFAWGCLACVMGQSGFGAWRREAKYSKLNSKLVGTGAGNNWVCPMLGYGGREKWGGILF